MTKQSLPSNSPGPTASLAHLRQRLPVCRGQLLSYCPGALDQGAGSGGTLRQRMALTQAEILRNHALYQTSFTGSIPKRTQFVLPAARGQHHVAHRGRSKKRARDKKKKTDNSAFSRELKRELFLTPERELEMRRKSRQERPKPWQESGTIRDHTATDLKLFYERTMPTDLSEAKLKTRKYVSNTKYGNIYEIRRDPPKKKEKPTTPVTWMWEGDFLLWRHGTRDKYLEETATRTKLVGAQSVTLGRPETDRRISPAHPGSHSGYTPSGPGEERRAPNDRQETNRRDPGGRHKAEGKVTPGRLKTEKSKPRERPQTERRTESEREREITLRRPYTDRSGNSGRHQPDRILPSARSTPRSVSTGSRPGSLPAIQEAGRTKPHPDVFAYYNSYRLEKNQRKAASIVIQKTFRGWLTRTRIKKLKRKALVEHGKGWNKFVAEYRQAVARIRSRYGIMKTSCCLDLKEIGTFMEEKSRYEAAFRKVAFGDKLHKDDLLEYFKECDLFPTEAEVNRSFSTVFRGSRNTADVIFLLDCSTSVGVIGFDNVIKFIRDIVMSLDIAPDRTRIGVIPFNEDIFNSFSITAYKNKMEVLAALSRIKVRHGLTRTDLALRLMLQMFKDARPGVQKLGIVISDGKSSDGERTETEARRVHRAGVELFAIGIGMDVDEKELKKIASTTENAFFAMDAKSLQAIRKKIEGRFCLDGRENNDQRNCHQGNDDDEHVDNGNGCQGDSNQGNCRYVHSVKPTDKLYLCRPMSLAEALDVVWTCYPPAACGLADLRFSRWIRPILDGTEAWSLLDDSILKATDIKTCLKLVINAKLERQGFISVPCDVTDGIARITDRDEALAILENYIQRQANTGNHTADVVN